MRGGFVGGDVGMMVDSMPTALDAQEAGLEPGEHFEIAPMPTSRTGDDDDGVVTAPARSWHITSTAAQDENRKYAASLFLRYLMDQEVATEVTLQGGDPPRHDAVLENEEFRQEVPFWSDASVDAFTSAGVFPVGANFPSVAEAMEQLNQYVINNPDEDPAAVAEQWQPELEAAAPDE